PDEVQISLLLLTLCPLRLIVFDLLVVYPSEFKQCDRVFELSLHRLRKLAISIGPFLLLRVLDAFFVGLPRILRRQSRGNAESVTSDVFKGPNKDCADIGIIHGLAESEHDGLRYESSQIRADFTTGKVALGASLPSGDDAARIARNTGIEKHGRISVGNNETETSIGIGVSVGANHRAANDFD